MSHCRRHLHQTRAQAWNVAHPGRSPLCHLHFAITERSESKCSSEAERRFLPASGTLLWSRSITGFGFGAIRAIESLGMLASTMMAQRRELKRRELAAIVMTGSRPGRQVLRCAAHCEMLCGVRTWSSRSCTGA
ncbi:unnamed protein product [Durusdinium trenchii]|uniref:Uncharacterized protein n=1 Tax=Durusdinium trenchii TaxID=1381693 RepID=A0ABP0M6D6_9DINO